MSSPLAALLEGDLETAKTLARQRPPDDAEACSVLARLALLEGRPADAAPLLDRAANQQATPVRFTRATLLYATGQRDDAVSAWLSLAKDDPRDAESRLAAGSFLLLANRLAEAETLLREATTLAPERAEAFLALARLLLVRGQTAASLEPLARALELDALNPATYATMAAALEELGQVDKLIPLLTEALKLLPGHVDLTLLQTNALLTLGRVDEALTLLAPLRKASPGLAALLEEEARLLAAAGRFDETLTVLATSTQPTCAQRLLAAMVHEAKAPPDLEAARVAYLEASELDLSDWRALNNLGLLMAAHGNTEAAEAAWEEAARRTERRVPAPLLNLAVQVARDEARADAAKALAREVIALGPSPQLADAQRLLKTLEA